jgi:hypothetical protein
MRCIADARHRVAVASYARHDLGLLLRIPGPFESSEDPPVLQADDLRRPTRCDQVRFCHAV